MLYIVTSVVPRPSTAQNVAFTLGDGDLYRLSSSSRLERRDRDVGMMGAAASLPIFKSSSRLRFDSVVRSLSGCDDGPMS